MECSSGVVCVLSMHQALYSIPSVAKMQTVKSTNKEIEPVPAGGPAGGVRMQWDTGEGLPGNWNPKAWGSLQPPASPGGWGL